MSMKPDWPELIAPLLNLSLLCDQMFECLTPGLRWYDEVKERFHRLEVAIDWEIARLQWERDWVARYEADMARERANAARRLKQKQKRAAPVTREFAEE